MKTMTQIRAWAAQRINGTDHTRAEIKYDETRVYDKYRLFYMFDRCGDGMPWFETCWLNLSDFRTVCEDVMRIYPSEVPE